MTGVLIALDFASMIFLIWTWWMGYQAGTAITIRAHIVYALGATALSVLAHSLTMMYVIAVGRMIRETVTQAELDPEFIAETRRYRMQVVKLASIAMLFVMLQTILGGGAHTRMFPLRIHEVLAAFVLLLNGYVVFQEIRCLVANHLLGHKVARLFESKDSSNVQ